MTPPHHASLSVTLIRGLPLFRADTDLAGEILAALARQGEALADADVLVVSQKIVSKCEGRVARLSEVRPGAQALQLAGETGRAAALVQLIIEESSEVLRASPAAIVARHRTGHVLANAGIDASNVGKDHEDTVLLWPIDPDASARALRSEIARRAGVRPAVLIADSMGRAWRIGTVGAAIGAAGLVAIEDRRGETDLFGRPLQATLVAAADAVAAAAVLAMGEAAEATPAALVRGASKWITLEDGPGMGAGLRPIEQDMFR